jgi:hypothetical protein
MENNKTFTKLTPEFLAAFGRLTNRLSPENLHCDGEISRAQAMKRKKQILQEWDALEKQVGRKVTEEETYHF